MCTIESYVDDAFYRQTYTNVSHRPPTIVQRNDTSYPRSDTSFSPRRSGSQNYHGYDLKTGWILPKSKKLFRVSNDVNRLVVALRARVVRKNTI